MFCPYCNYECEEQDRFCSHCGAPLTAPVQEKKGRHWVPILIMVLLISFGTGLFFAFPGGHSTPVHAGTPDTDTPWFSIQGGTLQFHEALYSGGSQLTVPETINGEAVIGLGMGCFEGCDELTEIILPETLETIGAEAFKNCTALRGIYIPESVAWISDEAFSGCTALEAVCINGSIEAIGRGTFSDCHKLFYIYFLGDFQAWTELYGEFITPYTVIFCEDGSFYQGGDPY